MKTVYFCEVERFGYTLQVIALTREACEKAIVDEYIRVFKEINDYDPRGTEYFSVFMEELNIEKRELGKVEWR